MDSGTKVYTFTAEERGVVIDALIEHAASAASRKRVNPESTSDDRVSMCEDLISRLGIA